MVGLMCEYLVAGMRVSATVVRGLGLSLAVVDMLKSRGSYSSDWCPVTDGRRFVAEDFPQRGILDR
jgi:hypothetical protein